MQLQLDQIVEGNPGDEFEFVSTSGRFFQTQYHFEVDSTDPKLVIGVWGPNNPSLGKARNKPGQKFVDRTLPKGAYRITVQREIGPRQFEDLDEPYKIVVKKNWIGKKVFGWGK